MADTFYANWAVCDINAELTHKASEACGIGDLLWYDSTNHCLRSAAVFTDQGAAAATQQAFAAVFAGVSNSKQLSSDAVAENCRCIIDRVFEFPCTSSTFLAGDYVAPAYSAGLNAQSLVKVTDPSLAIGRVVHDYTTAVTLVKVRLTATALNGRLAMDGSSRSNANVWANFRNIIDGGDFTTNPFQRGTTFTAIANTLTYGADRFFAVGGASSSISMSQQAQTDVAGFGNSLRWGRGSGTNTATINLGQVIETADAIRMQGRQVTLSFWAKAGAQFSAASGLTVQLISGTGTNQSAASMIAATWTGQANVVNATQALTTSAVRYTFTGTAPATCTQLGVLFSYAPTGTNNSSDTVDFYGIQLEDGPAATPFEHRDIEVELALCQRYFFQINEPASTVVVGAGMVTTSNNEIIFIPLPVQMRAAPTVTVTAGSFKFNVAGTATAVAGFAAGTTHTPNYISVIGTTTATAGQGTLLQGGGGAGLITASADF